MSEAAVQDILHRIDQLSQAERLRLQERLATSSGSNWMSDAERSSPIEAVPAPLDYPEAEFIESVAYDWTEVGFEVRQALHEHSKAAHADY